MKEVRLLTQGLLTDGYRHYSKKVIWCWSLCSHGPENSPEEARSQLLGGKRIKQELKGRRGEAQTGGNERDVDRDCIETFL